MVSVYVCFGFIFGLISYSSLVTRMIRHFVLRSDHLVVSVSELTVYRDLFSVELIIWFFSL